MPGQPFIPLGAYIFAMDSKLIKHRNPRIEFKAHFKKQESSQSGWIQGFNLINFHRYFNKKVTPEIQRYDSKWKITDVDLCQYIGMEDKNDVPVYRGHILKWCEIEAEYQEHYDPYFMNEHIGVNAKWRTGEVLYIAPSFTTNNPAEEESYCPLTGGWLNYDKNHLMELFSLEKCTDADLIDIIADLCLNDLKIEACGIEEFINKVNGFEVIGNVFDNPELLG